MPDLSPSNRWARWRALSWPDKARLLALAALLPVIDACLRGFGLRRTQALLGLARERATRTPSPAELAEAHQLAELAAIAGRRGLWGNTCLRQALAVQWWLLRRGLPAQLRLGARHDGDTLDAHAWVELDGQALAQHRELPPAFIAPAMPAQRDDARR